MKVSELIPGNKYNATCFNGNKCTFIETQKKFSEDCACVIVQYLGRLYIASASQLYIERR